MSKLNVVITCTKGTWISVGLFIMSIFFLYGWINCIHAKWQFEENDIKYRFLKANGNSALLKLLYQTDSLFNLNDNIFVKQVIDKKQYWSWQEKLHRIAHEKKKIKP